MVEDHQLTGATTDYPLTPTEAAGLLNCAPEDVLEATSSGQLTGASFGPEQRITARSVNSLLRARQCNR